MAKDQDATRRADSGSWASFAWAFLRLAAVAGLGFGLHVAIGAPPGGDARQFPFELVAITVDGNGLLCPATPLLIGPPGALQRCEPDRRTGQVRVAWLGKQPRTSICVGVGDPARSEPLAGLRLVQVSAGITTRLVVGVQDASTCTSPRQSLAPDARSQFVPMAPFGQPRQGPTNGDGGWQGRSRGHVDLVPTSRPAPPTTALTGTVLGTDGLPAAHTTVALGGPPIGTTAEWTTRTDDAGRFAFRGIRTGPLQARAGGGPEGLAMAQVEAVAGEDSTWNVRLQPLPLVRGTLRDDRGGTLAGWTVEYEGLDEPWFAVAKSRPDGSFAVPVERGPRGRLLLWAPATSCGLPMATVRAADPERSIGELTVSRPEVGSGLVVHLPPSHLDEGWYQEIVVFQEATGRGTVRNSGESQEEIQIVGMPAGWYRVFASTLSHGSIDLGRHWLDGHTLVDLGTIALPELAHVQFEWPQPPQGSPVPEVYQEGADVDLRLDGLDWRKPEGVDLPPGDFVMFWPDARGEVRHRRFTLRAGERTTVRCGG